ncbi:uncharacterized protein LOC117647792 [Thrips palmi]|uniref:Uncharacterized protein LOC117647792 n=1 Tax=Thrips palmi TaxID=161013 RepID=A0A6P8ZBU2_THRPL|nr:uncharacterized protein LOC117647792 [Thrips palmi]
MASKYVLVFWTKSKKINIVLEGSFVKSFDDNGDEIPLSEGTFRMVSIGGKEHEAKILRICSSKKHLESLLVTKEGEILMFGSKPPPLDLLAQKSKLVDEGAEDQKPDKDISKPKKASEDLFSQTRLTLEEASKCNHGCVSCCGGTLPPFPKLPDGFITALVSLAEYFQQFQRATENTVVPDSVKKTNMGKNLNSWQWASREKIELRKGSGVWVDAIKLEKIIGQAEITKKPPHQTLVKSLLTHLLGIERYIETSAEKINRRLLSAVVGYTNDKYPDLAQPIERYYRCINLNRGYLQKRKNEGVFENIYDTEYDGTGRVRRSDPGRSSRRNFTEESSDTRSKRPRRTSGRAAQPSTDTEMSLDQFDSYSNLDGPDQLMIPLDCEDGEDIPIVSSNDINKIIVVQNGNDITLPQTNSASSYSKGSSYLPPEMLENTDFDITFEDVNPNRSNVKLEEDSDYIEGALDFPL